MRKWVILFFVIKPFISLSQNEEYRGSAWASIVVRHKVSDNYNLVFDIGYRTFDDYFKRRKQDLIRGLIEGKISGKHSIGIGVAYFENISSNLSTFKKEFRPFLHYQFVNKSDKSFFNIRFRNEWRNYFEDNEIVKLFYKGLEWLRDVRKNAYKWDLTDPKIIVTLLPNMKTSHPVYDREKKTIAEHFGEITELWQCSVKHRYNVLDQTNDQIFSWKDPLFNASMLNIAPSYLERVEHIIKINKGEMNSIYPKKIKHNLFEWKTPCHEIFVDFETVGDIDENEESTIYLIGIYSDTYTHFLADSIHPLSEKEVILSFYQYWVESGKPKLWCWYAEETMWNRACKKHNLQLPLVWVDLYKVFFEGNVYVKGCKNFKLKSYVNSLLQLKKIKIDLPSET